jgi:hypothetical protein
VQITPVEVFVLVAASTALAKPTAKRIAPMAITTRLSVFVPKIIFMAESRPSQKRLIIYSKTSRDRKFKPDLVITFRRTFAG